MKRIKVLGYMAVVLMVLSAFKQDKVVTIF